MGRISIDFPEKSIFETTTSVVVNDLNYGNHMGNERLLLHCHEARIRWLEELGYSELNIEGVGIIQTAAAIVYRGEVHRGDQLTIEVFMEGPETKGFDLYYRVRSQQSQKVIGEVRTSFVFYNYIDQKVARTPSPFMERIKS